MAYNIVRHGFIWKTSSFLDEDTFKKLYTLLMRPHLEYDLLLQHKNIVKNVQIRATKLVDDTLKMNIDLPTLLHQRKHDVGQTAQQSSSFLFIIPLYTFNSIQFLPRI